MEIITKNSIIMKRIYLILTIMFAFCIVSCNNNKSIQTKDNSTIQNNTTLNKNKSILNNDLGKEWLYKFYSDYISFYLNSPFGKEKSSLPVFFKQLDSIKKENCTKDFYNYQKEDDFNNEFICKKSLETLEINQKKEINNTYIVSFIAEYPLNDSEIEYKKIYFDVTISEEKGVFKISKTCCF
jgi:hypothetical protein